MNYAKNRYRGKTLETVHQSETILVDTLFNCHIVSDQAVLMQYSLKHEKYARKVCMSSFAGEGRGEIIAYLNIVVMIFVGKKLTSFAFEPFCLAHLAVIFLIDRLFIILNIYVVSRKLDHWK